jgi:mono/diheme cytochrome c family protein
MRTNLTGFALTVGMGLIVVMLGFLGLSAANLVGFSADEARQTEAAERNQEEAWAAYQHELAHPKSKPTPMVNGVAASGDELASIEAGDALFNANCGQCHAVNEKVVGPALAGIAKRRSTPWLVSWVHNPAKVIASGDDYAVKLFDDNGKQQMPSFPQLSEKDIKDIISYISQQQGPPAQESSTAVAYNSADY